MFGGTYSSQLFGVRVFHHLFTTALISLWLLLRLLRGRGLPPTPLNPLLALTVIVWFASALLSLDPRMALENVWLPLTLLLLFFIMVDLLQSGRETLLIETQFLIAVLVVLLAGFQLASWYFGWGFGTSALGARTMLGNGVALTPLRLFVPLGVSTWLAAYTAPLAVLAGVWGLSNRRRDARIGLLLLASLLVIVMLLTGSRGGWISLAAGIAVFATLAAVSDERLRRLVRRFALPLGIGIVAVIAAGALALIVVSSSGGHAAGDLLRSDLWRGALRITADHPVLGVGVGEFGHAYRLVRDPIYVDNRLGTAHNFYLNTLAETGIVGAAVALALGFALIWRWWHLWQRAETTRRMRLAGAFAALVGFGAQSFFDIFTSTPLLLLALGLAAYCITETRSRIDPPLRGNRPAALAALIGVLIFGAGMLRSDQAQAAFNASLGGSLEQAEQAVTLDPALHLYSLQVAYLTGEQSPDNAAAIDAYRGALDLEPTWDTGWINLAALLERQGETSAALDALQRAIDIDNHNGALLMWARLAEARDAAPADAILAAYDGYLHAVTMFADPLPLSPFWSATELRQQALDRYLAKSPPDIHYRVLAAHNPDQLAALVPENPTTSAEWWVSGEYALTVEADPAAADADFTHAIDLRTGIFLGDMYASRARARVTLDPAAALQDLNAADLLGVHYESPNAVRAQLADTLDARRRLWANAVPPRIVDQNFEGVLFGGRVASFDLLPDMRLPGPGTAVLQPWYDLATSYLDTGETDRAINVYRAILDRAPDEADARAALDRLTASGAE